MKRHRYATLLLSIVLAAFMVGCSSTPTQESTGEYVDDSIITGRVQAAFLKDPAVKLSDVNVETYRGTVQLSGFVDDQNQINKALEIARQQKGVKTVVNKMQVKPTSSSSAK